MPTTSHEHEFTVTVLRKAPFGQALVRGKSAPVAGSTANAAACRFVRLNLGGPDTALVEVQLGTFAPMIFSVSKVVTFDATLVSQLPITTK